MTSYVAKTAIRKLLGKQLQDKFGQGDPYYDKIPVTKPNGEPTGKFVKQKRAIPTGLSAHDAKVLHRVRKRVHRLDWALFTLFGVGFGWSTVIGIIPGIGDAVDGLMSLSVFRKCCNVEGGLPLSVKLQMAVNMILDFVIGLVPGAEAIFRGNTRNALLLEDYLRSKYEKSKTHIEQDGPVSSQGSHPEHNAAREEDSGRYGRRGDKIVSEDARNGRRNRKQKGERR